MEVFVEKSLLFDFYGELLTEHQQRIYEEVVLNDYSASEIARDEGISRQSIHDMLRRCESQLENYENKLHLVERFVAVRTKALEIQELARNDGHSGSSEEERLLKIGRIAAGIVEDL